jgi:hypothetical protein
MTLSKNNGKYFHMQTLALNITPRDGQQIRFDQVLATTRSSTQYEV